MQQPETITAGQRGKGGAVPVSPWMENDFSAAKTDANILKRVAGFSLFLSWDLGPCLLPVLWRSLVLSDPYYGKARCQW